MLTIILGIVVCAIIFGVMFFLATRFECERIIELFFLIIFAVLIFSIIIGLFVPISGYQDWELESETELISLSNDVTSSERGFIYVSISANNVYTYRYEIETEFGTEQSKNYAVGTVSRSVIEVEDPNCTKPVLRRYMCKGKKSIWTFALWSSETQYVFYVPEGTIRKEVSLK